MARITLTHGGWADTGCWIAGHWGQYGADRLMQIARAEGWAPEDGLLQQERHVYDETFALVEARLDDIGTRGTRFDDLLFQYDWSEEDFFQTVVIASEEAEEYLNSICPDGYSFGWHDGEFFLMDAEWWEEES